MALLRRSLKASIIYILFYMTVNTTPFMLLNKTSALAYFHDARLGIQRTSEPDLREKNETFMQNVERGIFDQPRLFKLPRILPRCINQTAGFQFCVNCRIMAICTTEDDGNTLYSDCVIFSFGESVYCDNSTSACTTENTCIETTTAKLRTAAPQITNYADTSVTAPSVVQQKQLPACRGSRGPFLCVNCRNLLICNDFGYLQVVNCAMKTGRAGPYCQPDHNTCGTKNTCL